MASIRISYRTHTWLSLGLAINWLTPQALEGYVRISSALNVNGTDISCAKDTDGWLVARGAVVSLCRTAKEAAALMLYWVLLERHNE